MKSFDYIIKDKAGIHARPAGILAKEAKKFSSRITLRADGKESDATKLIAIMAMGIKCGTKVTAEISGEDEEEAAEKIEKVFKDNL